MVVGRSLLQSAATMTLKTKLHVELVGFLFCKQNNTFSDKSHLKSNCVLDFGHACQKMTNFKLFTLSPVIIHTQSQVTNMDSTW